MLRACALLVLLTALPGVAGAQGPCTPNRSELEEARALFVAGSAAVEAGRWADAISSFERAYALSCAASALYNLALARRALGRHREARDDFDRLLRDHPDMPPELRRSATTYRQEEAARVAVLELTGIAPDANPDVRFDGAPILTGERPILIETNAGSHSLVAQIPEHRPFLWDGTLGDGQRETIEVRFVPLPRLPPPGGFDWTWVVLGVVAAGVIAATIAIAVVLQDGAQLQPFSPGRVVRFDE